MEIIRGNNINLMNALYSFNIKQGISISKFKEFFLMKWSKRFHYSKTKAANILRYRFFPTWKNLLYISKYFLSIFYECRKWGNYLSSYFNGFHGLVNGKYKQQRERKTDYLFGIIVFTLSSKPERNLSNRVICMMAFRKFYRHYYIQ